ncbi:MAG TPA: hypothetical protein P5314_11445 [Tetrasphaera sp.]|nr:hypothetical protein [Tetrasphaera sp.]
MQPSSLIFLVVIAIWAAYLLQHWLGRREDLATARSVDRFSESMRILDRAARDQRAEPARAEVSSTRLHPRQVTVTRAAALLAATPAAATAKTAARTFGATAVSGLAGRRPAATGRRRAGRATRGLFVLGAGAFTLVTLVLATVGVVGWWVPILALVVTAGAQWWLRRAVVAERAARRAAPARPTMQRPATTTQRPVQRRAAQPPARVAQATAGGRVETVGDDTADAPATVQETPAARETLYDLAAIEEAEAESARARAAAEGWNPVPVPPPTYTLKAKAVPAEEILGDEDDDVASPFSGDVTDLSEYAERARLSG